MWSLECGIIGSLRSELIQMAQQTMIPHNHCTLKLVPDCIHDRTQRDSHTIFKSSVFSFKFYTARHASHHSLNTIVYFGFMEKVLILCGSVHDSKPLFYFGMMVKAPHKSIIPIFTPHKSKAWNYVKTLILCGFLPWIQNNLQSLGTFGILGRLISMRNSVCLIRNWNYKSCFILSFSAITLS